jgi:hypothetical protein
MKPHLPETVLALYASGDLDWRDRLRAAWHVRTCGRCGDLVRDFASDAAYRKKSAEAMPLPANWDSLAEEMAANIRLGLSAAECIRDIKQAPAVTVPARRRLADSAGAVRPGWFWKPAGAIAAAMAMVLTVWFATMPADQARVFSKAWDVVIHGRTVSGGDAPGIVFESSSSGVELRRGSRTSVKVLVTGKRPDEFSANLDGSMRAQYVDVESGQVTVTNVFTE